MTAKEYLAEVRRLKYRCDALKRESDELTEQAVAIGAIRYDKDRIQVSPDNMLEKQVLRIIKMREKYLRAVARYQAEIIKRETEIALLDRWEYEEVLRLRYLSFLSFSRIAHELGMSESHVKRLHGAALQAFSKVNHFPKDDTK